jgi:Cu(I)/Ag(I) efflux system membrane fusion protein
MNQGENSRLPSSLPGQFKKEDLMRRISLVVAIVAAIAVGYVFARRSLRSPVAVKASRHVAYYVDPMHPAYKSDKPGIAPDCGMELVPVYTKDGEQAADPQSEPPASAIAIDQATQRTLGIETVSAELASITRMVHAAGRVIPEDTLTYKINSGVDGFVKETYGDSVGTLVKKDQKLAVYYAPEFLTAASGFLAASERVPGSVSKEGARSIQNYTDRLRNLGMGDAQISRIAESRQLPESVDVVAPAEGFILSRNISPGQHFEHGMEFYTLANLSRVWIVAEVDQQDAAYLRAGGQARIRVSRSDREIPAHIADSLPQSTPDGATVKLRLEAENPGFSLRPEMLVDAELPIRFPQAVTAPLDALVDSGTGSRVYVQTADGVFEPREVETGWRSGDRVEIRNGLRSGERVVASSTFLVDSESRLRAPLARSGAHSAQTAPMASSKATKDPSCGMPVDKAAAAASGNVLDYQGATYYFCSAQCKRAYQARLSHAADASHGHTGD